MLSYGKVADNKNRNTDIRFQLALVVLVDTPSWALDQTKTYHAIFFQPRIILQKQKPADEFQSVLIDSILCSTLLNHSSSLFILALYLYN